MRKLVVFILAVAMCLAVLSFTACGDYDDSELLKEIEQLKDKNLDLERQISEGVKGDKGDKGDTGAVGPQGPKGDSGIGETLIIHKLGDIVTVYEQGVPMFSIKYASKTATQVFFEIKSINVPRTLLSNVLTAKAYVPSDNSNSTSLLIPSTYLDYSVITPAEVVGGINSLGSNTRIYFFSTGTGLIFAVFDI